MSSGPFGFGSISAGQLNGAQSDPFGNTMGGATQIGPTQQGGSQSDPFTNSFGGPSTIDMFASPFASHTNSQMPMAQPYKPMGQSQGSGGGQGGGGSQGGSQSDGGGSPLSMIGKVAGMFGGGSQGQHNTSPMGMFGGMKSPAEMYGAQQPGQNTGMGQNGGQQPGFISGMNGGQFGGLVGKIQGMMNSQPGQMGGTGQSPMGDASGGTNQMSAAPTATAGMAQNLSQLPTGGLDGGIGNLGSFLGGLF
jgi:hypothetical protein